MMFKRANAVLGALILVTSFTSIGCSNTNDTTDVTEKEVEEIKVEIRDDLDEDLGNDLLEISSIGSSISSFTTEISEQLKVYFVDNNDDSAEEYASTVLKSQDDINSVTNKLNEINNKMNTDKGRELSERLIKVYADYIEMLQEVALRGETKETMMVINRTEYEMQNITKEIKSIIYE